MISHGFAASQGGTVHLHDTIYWQFVGLFANNTYLYLAAFSGIDEGDSRKY